MLVVKRRAPQPQFERLYGVRRTVIRSLSTMVSTVKRVSLRRVVAVASVVGLLFPIAVLVRTLWFGRLFGRNSDLLLYPGSIFLFNQSRHSSLYGLITFGLSLIVTVALYVITAIVLFGIFRGISSVWRFMRRR